MNVKWLAQKTIYRGCVELIAVSDYGDRLAVAQPINLELVEQSRHAMIDAPTLQLHGESAQSLLQALWDAGLRPNDGAGSGAEAAALRKHIAFAERMADQLIARVSTGSQPLTSAEPHHD